MSRGGFRGRGRGGGRASFGGFDFSALGTTYQEIMSVPREPEQQYPPLDGMPTLADTQEHEKRASKYQDAMIGRLHSSKYYMVDEKTQPDQQKYSDRFRALEHPKLTEGDLDPAFFPPDLWQRYFNPKILAAKQKTKKKKKKVNLDDIGEEDNEDEEEGEDEEEDLDEYEDQEEDDYNENYFETGSQDDADDVGAVGDEGGGGGDFD